MFSYLPDKPFPCLFSAIFQPHAEQTAEYLPLFQLPIQIPTGDAQISSAQLPQRKHKLPIGFAEQRTDQLSESPGLFNYGYNPNVEMNVSFLNIHVDIRLQPLLLASFPLVPATSREIIVSLPPFDNPETALKVRSLNASLNVGILNSPSGKMKDEV